MPATCAEQGPAPAGTESTPVPELRKRVESANESDPILAVRLMCATIPRVEREYGRDSLEMAWWVQGLATPLIAYLEKYSDAIPLLEYARPILERRVGPNAPDIAEIHVAYAWMYFRQGLLEQCEAEWTQALRVREHTPGRKKIELQKVLVGLAQAQLTRRDFEKSRHNLERALAILQENGETVSEAGAAIENAFTNLLVKQEKFDEARQHAQTQVGIERQLDGGSAQLVPAYVLLGHILERLDEYDASEVALREAIRLSQSKEGPLQRHLVTALTQLGILLNARGKPEEALGLLTRGLEAAQATLGPDAPTLVRVLQSLADVHRALGQLPQALHLYERAGRIVELHRNDVQRQVLVSYYRGFGGLELSLGDREAAPVFLKTGLTVAGADETLSTERAGLLLTLARTSSDSDSAASRAQLLEALGLYRLRLPEGHPTILRVLNELCGVEIAESPGNAPYCAEAAARLENSREVEPALRQAIYANQSLLAQALSQAEPAHTFAIRALAAAAALGTPDPLWRAYFGVARSLPARQQSALAVFFGKQSIGQIERLRGFFVGEDRRLDRAFLSDKVDVYRTVADWLMEAGRIDEGLEILRLLKTEEMYDFVLRDAGLRGDDARVGLTDGEQVLSSQYSDILGADAAAGAEVDRLSRLKEAGRISAAESARLDALLVGQRRVEAARAERIRSFIADREAAQAGQGVSVRSVQAERLESEIRRFGPDVALAVYLLTDTHLRLLVATRSGQLEYQIPVQAEALRRDIGRFLDVIVKREDVSSASRALYETLARPVDDAARKAGASRIVLWPDDAIRYVPFAALSDGKRYLAEKYTLQIYSAAEQPASGPASSRSKTLTVRGLGVTRAVGGFRPLPSVADELCYIVRGPISGLEEPGRGCGARRGGVAAAAVDLKPVSRGSLIGNGALPGEGFADAAFTEARFNTLMDGPRDFSVLHLGTHFSLRPGNALRSFLLLGDGARLTLDKINARDFSNIELMTLSACQTGMGGAVTDDGREIEGLSAIVQRRGARRVISSLWQVEDASTARLMRLLYDELPSTRRDAARALQRAQLTLKSSTENGRHPYEHPYYWAAFAISSSQP
ncbi:MAG: CHAT domain-containing protein [Gammaproteobacteria bacterium]